MGPAIEALGCCCAQQQESPLALAQLEEILQRLTQFAGKLSLSRQKVELSSWAETLKKSFAEAAAEEPFELVVDCDGDLSHATIDPTTLEQALLELLANAGRSGAQRVTFAMGREQHGARGPLLRLSITDDGEGMPERLRRRAILPFETGWSHGQGLGLAMVSGIAHAHGGGLRLEGGVGEGTRATVLIPLSAQRRALLEHGGDETILVVDDERLAREAVRRVLTAAGYHVLHATGGPEAIDIVSGYHEALPLLLCDINMPHMNGFEVATRLVQLRPELKVLFMCGYPPDTLEGAPAGAQFIEKPFTHLELTGAVRKRLDQ